MNEIFKTLQQQNIELQHKATELLTFAKRPTEVQAPQSNDCESMKQLQIHN